MINVNDFKNGLTIKIDNNIYTVIDFQHVKPGKGSAFVRAKLKNIKNGTTIETTFNAGVKVEAAINACERVGMPEARIILAKTITEMALSPKSNSAHIALDMAINDIRSGKYLK